jgi:hypothetical protein
MSTVRPFTYRASDAELDDLRRRVLATPCPRRRPRTICPRACRSRPCRRSRTIGRRSTELSYALYYQTAEVRDGKAAHDAYWGTMQLAHSF